MKSFKLTWRALHQGTIKANDKQDAEQKFMDGDFFPEQIDEEVTTDYNSLEIQEEVKA